MNAPNLFYSCSILNCVYKIVWPGYAVTTNSTELHVCVCVERKVKGSSFFLSLLSSPVSAKTNHVQFSGTVHVALVRHRRHRQARKVGGKGNKCHRNALHTCSKNIEGKSISTVLVLYNANTYFFVLLIPGIIFDTRTAWLYSGTQPSPIRPENQQTGTIFAIYAS